MPEWRLRLLAGHLLDDERLSHELRAPCDAGRRRPWHRARSGGRPERTRLPGGGAEEDRPAWTSAVAAGVDGEPGLLRKGARRTWAQSGLEHHAAPRDGRSVADLLALVPGGRHRGHRN